MSHTPFQELELWKSQQWMWMFIHTKRCSQYFHERSLRLSSKRYFLGFPATYCYFTGWLGWHLTAVNSIGNFHKYIFAEAHGFRILCSHLQSRIWRLKYKFMRKKEKNNYRAWSNQNGFIHSYNSLYCFSAFCEFPDILVKLVSYSLINKESMVL